MVLLMAPLFVVTALLHFHPGRCLVCDIGSFLNTKSGNATCQPCPRGSVGKNWTKVTSEDHHAEEEDDEEHEEENEEENDEEEDHHGEDHHGEDPNATDAAQCGEKHEEQPWEGLCEVCPTGKYAPCDGMTACLDCPAGKYSEQAHDHGNAFCKDCQVGKANSQTAASQCYWCGFGQYQGSTAATACEACPAGMTTVLRNGELNATSSADCRCPEGTYLPCLAPLGSPGASGASGSPGVPGERSDLADACAAAKPPLPGVVCTPCPGGFECPGGFAKSSDGRLTHQQPVPLRGFYVEGIAPYEAFKCRDAADWCVGGGFERCAGGRQGFQCAHCHEGEAPIPQGPCRACSRGGSAGVPLAAAAFALLGVIMYRLRLRSSGNQGLTLKVEVLTTCTIVVTHLQLLGVLGSLQASVPAVFSGAIAAGQVMCLDFSTFQPSCTFGHSLGARYLPGTLLPPAVVAAAVLAVVLFRLAAAALPARCSLLNHDAVVACVGVACRTALVGVCKAIFGLFEPADNPSGGRTMLRYDGHLFMDQESRSLLPVAAVAILFSVVAPLSVQVYATWRSSARWQEERFRRRFGFLFQQYTPRCHFWGLVVILRNVAVGLMPSAVPMLMGRRDGAVELLAFLAIVLPTLLGLLRLWPWRSEQANRVDAAAQMALVVTLISSLSRAELGPNSEAGVDLVGLVAYGLSLLVAALVVGQVLLQAMWVSKAVAGAERHKGLRAVVSDMVSVNLGNQKEALRVERLATALCSVGPGAAQDFGRSARALVLQLPDHEARHLQWSLWQLRSLLGPLDAQGSSMDGEAEAGEDAAALGAAARGGGQPQSFEQCCLASV